MTPFDRLNLYEQALERVVAHGGLGTIFFRRLADTESLAGACNFIDLAIVPPGCSIGRHRHAADEEEFYLVLAGSGRMWREGQEIRVGAGDLIRNPPGGAHGLINDGDCDIRLFVFEVPLATG
jgi:mannose-6-phosphate isomerase-like protein (cupin superfamily)